MDSKGQFVLTKIDFTPRPKKAKKKQEEVSYCMGKMLTRNGYLKTGHRLMLFLVVLLLLVVVVVVVV